MMLCRERSVFLLPIATSSGELLSLISHFHVPVMCHVKNCMERHPLKEIPVTL